MTRLFYIFILLGLYGCGNKNTENNTPQADNTTIRTIQQGELIGTRAKDNAQAWYGIPYAQAPVGDLRWRAPRKAPSWEGRFEALSKTHRCPQYNLGADGTGPLEGSEDCLYLNIWAPPTQTKDNKLPVMFWIHGGGNVWGYAGQYEMGRLAARHNVIVVAVNYRLGPFGWFAHESIRETAETAYDRSANFATLDLIQALDWVEQNIGEFGGDKNNITVLGESAGAYNTASLLISPVAKGKFHKAIIQSGSFETHTLQEAEIGPVSENHRKGYSSNEAIAALKQKPEGFDKLSSAELAQWLRAQDTETILNSYKSLQKGESAVGAYDSIDITDDGIVIPIGGAKGLLSDPTKYNAIPTIMGTNRDELRIASFFDEELTGNFFNVLYWAKDLPVYQAFSSYPSRLWRAYGAEEPAKAMVSSGNKNVFTYRFDWDEQGSIFFTNISDLIGACHALEMGFVFGDFESEVNNMLGIMFNEGNKQGREILSDAMMSYWAQFAYTGSPGKGRNGDLPEWHAWTADEKAPKAMIFDTEQDGGVRTTSATTSIEAVLADLRIDPNFTDDSMRCKAVENIASYLPFLYDDLEADIKRYCKE